MSLSLDHVFLLCSAGAPEGDALVRAGLREGSRNAHPGQGTANRRFFFRNAYLELLWVSDPAEAQSETTRPTRLWERWSGRAVGCCPFGVVVRTNGIDRPPFPTRPYYPQYLPAEHSIDIALGTPLSEPEFFHLGFARTTEYGRIEPTDHAVGVNRLQELRLEGPWSTPRSEAVRAVEAAGLVSFRQSATWHLELFFDESGDDMLDFRPQLPLALRF